MDRTSFEALLKEHRDAVYSTARCLLRNAHDAEDVVQETFVRLWKARDEIQIESARYWLLRVCRNLCLDHLRRKKVRDRARDDTSQGLGRGRVGIERVEDDGRERFLDVSDLGSGALHTELTLDIQRIVDAMKALKEPQRSIILLREIQDLSYEEIAETLDLSLSAVKVYLHRARKKIRAAFESEALGESGAST